MSAHTRLLLIGGVMIAFIVAVCTLPPISQNPSYHLMADQRTLLGVTNFWNVLSNLPFLLVGAFGLRFALKQVGCRRDGAFVHPREAWPYVAFFAGVLLTGVGSVCYHLAPTNGSLVWDRLPMTMAFTAIVAAVVAERVSVRLGLAVLLPLLAIGVASVGYWYWTEAQGRGDLRSYGAVQGYPIIIIPMLMLLFPAKYTRSADLGLAFLLYAAAKVFEQFDSVIFQLGSVVSGHTLKHLAAGLATYVILRMLMKRRPFPTAAAHAVSTAG